jgi:hypothetical protein
MLNPLGPTMAIGKYDLKDRSRLESLVIPVEHLEPHYWGHRWILPPNLTSLRWFGIEWKDLKVLPPTLTDLHFYVSSSLGSMTASKFFATLPRVKTVESSLLAEVLAHNPNSVVAKLRLTEEYLPAHATGLELPQEMQQKLTKIRPTDSASSYSHLLQPLSLPEDAISRFKELHSEVKIIGVELDLNWILEGVPTLCVSSLKLTGTFWAELSLLAPGLQAAYLADGDFSIPVQMPHTVTRMTLGSKTANQLLGAQAKPWLLPPSLTERRMEGDFKIPNDHFPNVLPPNLTLLDLTNNVFGFPPNIKKTISDKYPRMKFTIPPHEQSPYHPYPSRLFGQAKMKKR